MSHVTHTDSTEILIRSATAKDLSEVARVAARDTQELPAVPLLVAQVGPDVRAAISLTDGSVVADPFHRTTELVEMLKIRARAVRSARSGVLGMRRRARRRSLTATRAA